MRRFYQILPLVKPVTQGSIINHCIADNYQGKDVYGMIITPRCDLDHQGKINTVHYLPIVDFTDWINVDGEDYFFNKWSQRIVEKFKDKCKTFSFPDDLNKKELYDIIAEKKIDDKDKRNAFKDVVKNYFDINRNSDDFANYKAKSDTKKSLVNNLMEDKLPAYYLIEDWKPERKRLFVILLRELKRISINTTLLLNKEVKKSQINPMNDDLDIDHIEDDFFKVCSLITSPFVEHIMQHFSHNFCRIGVEDRDFEIIRNLMFNAIN